MGLINVFLRNTSLQTNDMERHYYNEKRLEWMQQIQYLKDGNVTATLDCLSADQYNKLFEIQKYLWISSLKWSLCLITSLMSTYQFVFWNHTLISISAFNAMSNFSIDYSSNRFAVHIFMVMLILIIIINSIICFINVPSNP